MDITTLDEIFERFDQLHVVVIGDLMLDKYYWGNVDRISPEAPVPVVAVKDKEIRLGGAANVALNCKQLGAKVTVASVIGDDEDGQILLDLLAEQEIETKYIQKSKFRATTSKTRILSRNQQMIRLDEENCEDLNTKEEHPFIDSTLRFLQIQKPDLVIFEDYNKGVLKANVIHRIIEHCQHLGIVMSVDPKKKNFLEYKGVHIFKPNLKEVKEGLDINIEVINEHTLNQVHEALQERLNHKVSFITLSEKGVYFHDENAAAIFPSYVRNVADVSGAGDTVISVASMVYCVTKDTKMMATLSNLAGGMVCEEVGVVPINKPLFYQKAIKHLVANS